MNNILIFPCNSTSIEIYCCFSSVVNFIGFVDDEKAGQQENISGLPVFDRSAFAVFPDAKVIAVPGGPNTFLKKRKQIESLNLERSRFSALKHSSATVSEKFNLGINTVLFPNVVLTSNGIIDDHTVVLPGTIIHHDAIISKFNFIGSRVVISGNVTIMDNCFIGNGTTIINNTTISENVLLGTGSNVLHSIPANQCWAGNPARYLKNI
jgi:sugar O-acyltransferase (sialic acid O-acetyltransferase NeuD family)